MNHLVAVKTGVVHAPGFMLQMRLAPPGRWVRSLAELAFCVAVEALVKHGRRGDRWAPCPRPLAAEQLKTARTITYGPRWCSLAFAAVGHTRERRGA
jgi:hypothetical protein